MARVLMTDALKPRAVDTLQFTKQAVAAGFTQQQAEFQAEKIAAVEETLVTKEYFKQEIRFVEQRLASRITKATWSIIVGVPSLMTFCSTVAKLFLS
jgi:hypothetical protein